MATAKELRVPCRKCGALVGEECWINRVLLVLASKTHAVRTRDARRTPAPDAGKEE